MTIRQPLYRLSFWQERVIAFADDAIITELPLEEFVTGILIAAKAEALQNGTPAPKPDRRREYIRRAILNLISRGFYAVKEGNIIVLS